MTPEGLASEGALAMKVGAAALASWVLPEAAWPPFVGALARIQVALGMTERGARTLVDHEISRRTGRSVASIHRERVAYGYESRMWALREYARHKRDPQIRIVGRGHLDEALAAGRGAILWVGRFMWASIITKVGLHGAGYAVSHLSRPTHGFGSSAFAVNHLNPVWTRIEDRFLNDRIVIAEGTEKTALRALRRRLGTGGIVSITVGPEGSRTVSVPFFGGEMVQATGVAGLAAASGARLLTVFTVVEDGGGFLVEIEGPLVVKGDGPRDRRDLDVVEQLADRTRPWVERYPGQWLG